MQPSCKFSLESGDRPDGLVWKWQGVILGEADGAPLVVADCLLNSCLSLTLASLSWSGCISSKLSWTFRQPILQIASRQVISSLSLWIVLCQCMHHCQGHKPTARFYSMICHLLTSSGRIRMVLSQAVSQRNLHGVSFSHVSGLVRELGRYRTRAWWCAVIL